MYKKVYKDAKPFASNDLPHIGVNGDLPKNFYIPSIDYIFKSIAERELPSPVVYEELKKIIHERNEKMKAKPAEKDSYELRQELQLTVEDIEALSEETIQYIKNNFNDRTSYKIFSTSIVVNAFIKKTNIQREPSPSSIFVTPGHTLIGDKTTNTNYMTLLATASEYFASKDQFYFMFNPDKCFHKNTYTTEYVFGPDDYQRVSPYRYRSMYEPEGLKNTPFDMDLYNSSERSWIFRDYKSVLKTLVEVYGDVVMQIINSKRGFITGGALAMALFEHSHELLKTHKPDLDVQVYSEEDKQILEEIVKGNENIDLFLTSNYKSPLRFHLQCVKSFISEEGIYVSPGTILAAIVGHNTIIRTHFGKTDMFTILEKYSKRGFKTLYSEKDVETLKKYNPDYEFEKINIEGCELFSR